MLINLSNHPSTFWDEKQKQAAGQYGQLTDIPFPSINPEASTDNIALLAETYESKVRKLLSEESSGPFAVHIMGEFTFCFALVARLQKSGIPCFASTTRRQTVNHPDGSKTSKFYFVVFREYPTLFG